MPPVFDPTGYFLPCIEQIAEHLKLVALDADEYLGLLQQATARRTAAGAVYDALPLACARKAKVDRILTWNIRHFQSLAPDLADRIVAP